MNVDDLIKRMKRIEGQSRGVARMLEEGRNCEEVIMQLTAMRAALSKVAMAVMADHLEECLLNNDPNLSREEALQKAKDIFLKFS